MERSRVQISFESNLREWTAAMTAFERQQLPFATALALTDTARNDVKPDIERQIDRVFERPIEFTRRGVGYRPANKSTLVSTVFIKDVQAGYLEIEEYGGVRTPKRRALVIPAGQKVNSYGNLPRGTVKRLLARKDTFSGRVNGVGGIWKRTRKGVKLLIAWEERAEYRPRFGFHETAMRSASFNFARRFENAFNRALQTAR